MLFVEKTTIDQTIFRDIVCKIKTRLWYCTVVL